MRCNGHLIDDIADAGKFQSLLGFLMRCNRESALIFQLRMHLFQSLLGFLMRCNVEGLAGGEPHHEVSIPIGFSNAL